MNPYRTPADVPDAPQEPRQVTEQPSPSLPKLSVINDLAREILRIAEDEVPGLRERYVHLDSVMRLAYGDQFEVHLLVWRGMGRTAHRASGRVIIDNELMLASDDYQWVRKFRDDFVELARRLVEATAPLNLVADAYEVPGE